MLGIIILINVFYYVYWVIRFIWKKYSGIHCYKIDITFFSVLWMVLTFVVFTRDIKREIWRVLPSWILEFSIKHGYLYETSRNYIWNLEASVNLWVVYEIWRLLWIFAFSMNLEIVYEHSSISIDIMTNGIIIHVWKQRRHLKS